MARLPDARVSGSSAFAMSTISSRPQSFSTMYKLRSIAEQTSSA
jgi:hypothetical protein